MSNYLDKLPVHLIESIYRHQTFRDSLSLTLAVRGAEALKDPDVWQGLALAAEPWPRTLSAIRDAVPRPASRSPQVAQSPLAIGRSLGKTAGITAGGLTGFMLPLVATTTAVPLPWALNNTVGRTLTAFAAIPVIYAAATQKFPATWGSLAGERVTRAALRLCHRLGQGQAALRLARRTGGHLVALETRKLLYRSGRAFGAAGCLASAWIGAFIGVVGLATYTEGEFAMVMAPCLLAILVLTVLIIATRLDAATLLRHGMAQSWHDGYHGEVDAFVEQMQEKGIAAMEEGRARSQTREDG